MHLPNAKVNKNEYMTKKSEKISQIISLFCDSRADFGRRVGVEKQSVNNWLNREVGDGILHKILDAFPEVNPAWLLADTGNIVEDNRRYEALIEDKNRREGLKNDGKYGKKHSHYAENVLMKTSVIENRHDTCNPSGQNMVSEGVPYFKEDFMSFGDKFMDDSSVLPSFYIKYRPYSDATFYCNINGYSMTPVINSGDVVAMKKIDDFSYLLNDRIYGIITSNGLMTVKKVRDEGDTLFLIPENKSGAFGEQKIPKGIVKKVYLVLGVIKDLQV